MKELEAGYDFTKEQIAELEQLRTANAKLVEQVGILREALQTLIYEHEECTDADDWMAFMCSPEAIHVAQEFLDDEQTQENV